MSKKTAAGRSPGPSGDEKGSVDEKGEDMELQYTRWTYGNER
jgi:hypothetical protein